MTGVGVVCDFNAYKSAPFSMTWVRWPGHTEGMSRRYVCACVCVFLIFSSTHILRGLSCLIFFASSAFQLFVSRKKASTVPFTPVARDVERV